MVAQAYVAEPKSPARSRQSVKRNFINDENGATAIEYGLIMALVFLAAVSAIQAFSDSVINIFDANSEAVENVLGGGN